MREKNKTSLYEKHLSHRGKMVEFAGYELPIQYEKGILAEHEWVRKKCGIFDVSHMGQFTLEGKDAADILSYLTPSNFRDVKIGKCVYTVLTSAEGGILDDLIITRQGEEKFLLVVNASRKEADFEWIESHLVAGTVGTVLDDYGLIALQGPEAEKVLQPFVSIELSGLSKMQSRHGLAVQGHPCFISRTGYTGEDGFEISAPAHALPDIWQTLVDAPECAPIGLGARDSLRLEAGFPLYGAELTETTTPVEAGIKWIISEGHTQFIGHKKILSQLEAPLVGSPAKKRIALKLLDKGIPRSGCPILQGGTQIGTLTSGAYIPTLKTAIAQGYVEKEVQQGETLHIELRGKPLKAEVHKLSFLEK